MRKREEEEGGLSDLQIAYCRWIMSAVVVENCTNKKERKCDTKKLRFSPVERARQKAQLTSKELVLFFSSRPFTAITCGNCDILVYVCHCNQEPIACSERKAVIGSSSVSLYLSLSTQVYYLCCALELSSSSACQFEQ